jgi:hypothetical protein
MLAASSFLKRTRALMCLPAKPRERIASRQYAGGLQQDITIKKRFD